MVARAATIEAPSNIDEQDLARLKELAREFERATEREERTETAHKAAKKFKQDCQERVEKFLWALSHGMPLFETNVDGEE